MFSCLCNVIVLWGSMVLLFREDMSWLRARGGLLYWPWALGGGSSAKSLILCKLSVCLLLRQAMIVSKVNAARRLAVHCRAECTHTPAGGPLANTRMPYTADLFLRIALASSQCKVCWRLFHVVSLTLAARCRVTIRCSCLLY
jgi:hypothetical protein